MQRVLQRRIRLTNGRRPVEHASMQVITITESDAAAPPAPLADVIQVWFVENWPAPRKAAESLALRGLLASHLGTLPEHLQIVRDEHGKPRIANSPLEFNLSHTRSSALVGICDGNALGVDLEHLGRERPVLQLAQRFFAPSEASALSLLDPLRRQTAFLELWCCKEAVLKALGRGLGFGLARVEFALNERGEPKALTRVGEDLPHDWHVVRLRPAPDFAAALAWQGPARRVQVCRTPPLV